MFGYIRPVKPQLKICDYDDYRTVFANLQKTVKKQYGIFFKTLLDLDFVLPALLESAFKKPADIPAGDTPAGVAPAGAAPETDFTAAAAVILIRFKLEREKKLTRKILLGITKRNYEKAALKYPELTEYISKKLEKQAKLTDANCKSIDRASEPFADCIGEIFSYMSGNKKTKAILRRTGFFTGRYIYIMNAFENVLNDYKKGGFNPLVVGNAVVNELNFEAVMKKTEHSINFTLGALADAYVQLKYEKYKPIVDNIINIGLKQSFYDLAEVKKQQQLIAVNGGVYGES